MRHVLTVILVLLIILGVWVGTLGWWKYISLHARVSLAEDQTAYFQEIVDELKNSVAPHDFVGASNAIAIYYPSGSKQRPGSNLDRIVERARSIAMNEINEMRSQGILKLPSSPGDQSE